MLPPYEIDLDYINHVVLVKQSVEPREMYLVMYDDAHRNDALRAVADWAGNPELSLTWQDAEIMGRKIMEGQKP